MNKNDLKYTLNINKKYLLWSYWLTRDCVQKIKHYILKIANLKIYNSRSVSVLII